MIFIILTLNIFFAEVLLKKYVEVNKEMYKKEELFHGKIILERYHNKGAMLNFLEDKVELVKTISAAILGILLVIFGALLPKKGNYILKLGLSLVLGGALSNVYDRFKRGYVVDYFSFKFLKKIVFNISDICIFIGSLLITICSFFKED